MDEFEGLPSREDWVRMTSEGVHERGQELVTIDAALGDYHQSKAYSTYNYGGLGAVVAKMKILTIQLAAILQACEVWLTAEVRASGQTWELGQSGRTPLVRRLFMNTVEALEVLDPHKKAYDSNNPTVYFRHVASDYRWQMLLPLIHNFDADNPGKQLASLNILEADPAVNPEHFYGSKVAEAFAKQEDFKFVFDFIRQAKFNESRVIYLPKDNRWPHEIVFYQGLAYRVDQYGKRTDVRATGEGVQLLISGKSMKIYALNAAVRDEQVEDLKQQILNQAQTQQEFDDDMESRLRLRGQIYSDRGFSRDSDGIPETFKSRRGIRDRIYSTTDLDEIGTDPTPVRLKPRLDIPVAINTQHSTFLAGEPVFFAGGCTFDPAEPGRLIELDNGSGHYQTKDKSIADTLKFFQASGFKLDLKKIEIQPSGKTYDDYDQDWVFGPLKFKFSADLITDDEALKREIGYAQAQHYRYTIKQYEGGFINWPPAILQNAIELGAISHKEALAFGLKPKPRQFFRLRNPFG